jgi:hypothetical protein
MSNSSFDPTSSSSATGSALCVCAIFGLGLGAYVAGRSADTKSGYYNAALSTTCSAACLFLIALWIFFQYD